MRIVTFLLAALISACGLLAATTGNASALGGETLTCRVTPGRVLSFNRTCANSMGASSYQVTFVVQNETAPSTYAWSISAGYPWTVSNGCTSTAAICTISITNTEEVITASVTLTQNGATETLVSRANIGQYCGNTSCI